MSNELNTWGPPLWSLIHSIAFATRDADVPAVYDIIRAIATNVPCEICSQHGAHFFSTRTRPRRSKELFEFTVNFHNEVNRRRQTTQVTVERAALLHGNGRWRQCGQVIPTVVAGTRTTLYDVKSHQRMKRLAKVQDALSSLAPRLQG